MDYDIVFKKIDGTSTVDRKEGIHDLLTAVKGHIINDSDENVNQRLLGSILKDKTKMNFLLKALGRSLRDPDWEIKRDSLEVVMCVLMKELLGEDVDSLMSSVVPHLISCLSDNKMTVRKGATQCLHELWLKSHHLSRCLTAFVEYGLHGALDISQRRDNNLALQVLLTSHFSSADLSIVIDGVLFQLDSDPNDDRLITIVCGVLRSIKKVIGDDRFSQHLRQTSPKISGLYQLCATSLQPRSTSIDSRSTAFFLTAVPPQKLPSLATPIDDNLYLGFIPRSVVNDIENDRKLEAIEEMSNLLAKIRREGQFGMVSPHLAEILRLLQRLMEDKYLVVVTTLKLLIELLGSMEQQHVESLLDPLLQLLRLALAHNPNGDAIIQKAVMSYSMLLFRKSDSRRLLTRLCDQDFMNDLRQSSVRQSAIDIVISALITFPSTKFDLDFLAAKVAHRLVDKKYKVKQAALECISVIGYTYGNGKVNTLLKIIEHSSRFDSSNGVIELVQSRLSKHRLPHIDDHGLVVYVNDGDKTNNPRQQSVIDLENSSSDNSPISSANPLEKRRPSAGKVRGRAKFPWDQNEGNSQNSAPYSKAPGSNSLNQIQPSDSIPIQYSQGSISVMTKQMSYDGKTIKKLNDIQSFIDNDNHLNRNPPISGRSFSSDFNTTTSMNTSGYSSNTNTSRRNTDFFIKQSPDIPTVTNSTNVTPRNPATFRFEDNNSSEINSIPTKPTLGRSAGSRRKELDSTSYPSIGSEGTRVDINDMNTEAISSTMLDSVRNSAAKKKALTIFNASTNKVSPNNTHSDMDQRVAQSQFSGGPKGPSSEANHSNKNNEVPIVYNPYKGATFKPNPLYDGLIVGKGVSTATEINEPLKKKQPVKGLLETSIGNISQRSTLNHQPEAKKPALYTDDLVTANSSNPINSNSPRNSKTNPKTIGTIQKEIDFSDGIVGKSIVDKNGLDDESDEESNKGVMSKTLRESLSIKRQKAANELNSYKSDSTMMPTPPSPHSAPGSGSYQAANRKPPVGGYYHNNNSPSSAGNERDFGYDTVPPSRKPLRPAHGNSTPKKIKPLSQTVPNALVNPVIDPSTLSPTPLSNPDKSIPEFLQLVQNEDWEHKISALIIVQSLAQYHPETLISRPTDLHSICIAICKECKNLRSQVAKCAIQTVSSLFTNLRKTMDSELDIIIVNMLSKGGDASSIFLRQDVEMTLTVMIDNVTPQRAIIPLITNGADNKNTAIRRLAASNIMQIVEKVGAVKLLSGAKEITEKLLQVVVKFVMDCNQETRYYAKRILLELNSNTEFEKIANKIIPAKDVRFLVEAIENLKSKGLGDPPQFSQSASIRRSGSLSRGGSAGNLVSLEQKASEQKTSLSRGNSRSMSRLPGSELSADDDDWLSKTCSDLSSSDFRLRQNGLDSLLNRQETFGLQIPQRGLAKLLNEFIPRLNDNNSKVAATGLNVCRKIIPSICSIFPTEFISRLINTVALNFASKSPELKESAKLLMDVCFDSFDPSLLVQPCVEAMNKANVKTRLTLIEVVNVLLDKIITTKSASTSNKCVGAVSRHLAPQIGLLLEQNRPLPISMRESLHKLVLLSHEIVGPEIVESACRERSHLVRQALIDILNSHS